MLEAKDQGYYVEVFSENKRQKKIFTQNIRKYSAKFKLFQKKRSSKNFFRKFFGVLQGETTLLMTLVYFQQVKK